MDTFDENEPRDKIQNYMKEIDLDRISHKKCEEKITSTGKVPMNFTLDKSFVCAGGEKGIYRDVCKGDEGGPLVCQKKGKTK